jgi:hypothetical protein
MEAELLMCMEAELLICMEASVSAPATMRMKGKHASADRSSDLEGPGSDESLSISSRGRAPKSDSDPHLAQPKAVCGVGLFSCCGSRLAKPGWCAMAGDIFLVYPYHEHVQFYNP